MVARFVSAVVVVLAMAAPAWAADGDLQIFQDVSKQVLRYSNFTIFDVVSSNAQTFRSAPT